MAENSDKGEAMDWTDEEVSDDGGFVLLPEGMYAFEVAKLEKGRFEGSEKMAACPRANLTLNVWTEQGWVQIIDRIMLNTKAAWRVARFFEALGYAKNPETGKVPVKWNEVEGKQGYLKLKVREYESKGEKRKANDVEEYLKPEDWPESGQATAQQTSLPVPPQPVSQQQPHQGWSM